jgi:hypothetical protein
LFREKKNIKNPLVIFLTTMAKTEEMAQIIMTDQMGQMMKEREEETNFHPLTWKKR